MNLNITLKDLAGITDGRIIKGNLNYVIKKINTDSRKIKKDNIFWALKGKNFDGNNFVEDAVMKGATGIISSIKPDENILKKVKFYLYVKDTLKALHKLAEYHRKRFNLLTVSITGSNGKTTTKEMLKHVLAHFSKTAYNPFNFNNEYGLPLSILELTSSHKFGVYELGATKKGDIKTLARIVKPDIAVITTISPEHLEFFKNMQNVFDTETEVINYLNQNGYLVYNGDNKYLKKIKFKNSFTFGFRNNNFLKITLKKNHAEFKTPDEKFKIKLKNHIEHNYLNAAAVFLVAKNLNLNLKKTIKLLEKFKGVELRMQVIKEKNRVIILDAYNANPQSMENAIKEISRYKKYSLILGDMKELGNYSAFYHRKLAEYILKFKPDYIFLIGPEIKTTFENLKEKFKNVKYYSNTDEGISDVKEFIRNYRFNILIKASRAMQFERFIK